MDGTFSIVGRDPRAQALGIAVATGAAAVGMRVPHAALHIGAIATQARTDATYGSIGLRLLELGFRPTEVLDALLWRDPDHNHRQVAVLDSAGRAAVHTGAKVPPEAAECVGRDCVVIGNTLVRPQVVEDMLRAFEAGEGEELADRLLNALRAGQAAGGDRRGAASAALLVVDPRQITARIGPYVDLRVDAGEDPVAELAHILARYREWRAGFLEGNEQRE